MKLKRNLLATLAFAAAALSASTGAYAEDASQFYVSATGGYSACLDGFSGLYDKGEPRLGGDWGVNLGWISKSKIGAGLSYSGFTSTGKETLFVSAPGGYGFLKEDMRFLINYVAPQFIFQTNFGKSKWFFNTSAGVGVLFFSQKASYKESIVEVSESATSSGVACNVYAGFGYAINSHFAITANLGYTHSFFRVIDGYEHSQNMQEYINRINLDFGLKYTF